jgi:hypothetical protein
VLDRDRPPASYREVRDDLQDNLHITRFLAREGEITSDQVTEVIGHLRLVLINGRKSHPLDVAPMNYQLLERLRDVAVATADRLKVVDVAHLILEAHIKATKAHTAFACATDKINQLIAFVPAPA